MEQPKRKPNRLKHWDYSQPGAYFVTICTRERAKILCDIVGDGAHAVPQVILTEYGKIVDAYIRSANHMNRVTVDKYVIMPNHIHLIVFVTGDSGTARAPSPTNAVIPRMVATLKRLTTKQIGASLFQRSFHDHIIRDEKDYQIIWQYIDQNPLKWELDCFYTP